MIWTLTPTGLGEAAFWPTRPVSTDWLRPRYTPFVSGAASIPSVLHRAGAVTYKVSDAVNHQGFGMEQMLGVWYDG